MENGSRNECRRETQTQTQILNSKPCENVEATITGRCYLNTQINASENNRTRIRMRMKKWEKGKSEQDTVSSLAEKH